MKSYESPFDTNTTLRTNADTIMETCEPLVAQFGPIMYFLVYMCHHVVPAWGFMII
jgi:hypothetical protein